jgi:Ser/Thr protein kinase RdoA (MazF antagonist)
MQTQHPFETLTPPFVQDALTHIGLWGDGRLMALNSYENRVYLAHLDDAIEGHTAVILKFYRPNRWRQAQIAEEHAFAWELQDAEVPVVAPLRIQGQTLHAYEGFWFSVSPRWGGRMPELGNFETLEWIGRLLARLHNVGQTQAFVHRPTMDAASYGHASATYLLGSNDIIPSDLRNPWAGDGASCPRAVRHWSANG